MRTENLVILIGNVTWKDELKHSEGKKAVLSFGMATNRNTFGEDGQKHEEADYHKVVSFGRLAEVCSEFLSKGRRVYIKGKLQSRAYTDNEGIEKATTEIVLDDFLLLDNKPEASKKEIPSLQGEQQAATV